MAHEAAGSAKIGMYDRITETRDYTLFTIDEHLSLIKDGRYQDEILAVRNEPDKAKRQKLKKNTLPYFTISGIFSTRQNKALEKHSGFIAIDIDNVEDPEALKSKLSEDDYCYAIYVSAGGRGLCVLIRIKGKEHERAFKGLVYYFYDRHGLLIDTCGDVSRPRYVSWDPYLSHNPNAKVFEEYPPIDAEEEKAKRKFKEPVFVAHDFEELIIELAKVNTLDEYMNWYTVGFALAAKFGESGRRYFHSLSKSSPKYDEKECDRKYDNLVKSHSEEKDKKSTLATIYWLAKKHGIQIASTKTNQGVKKALTLKTAGIDPTKATAKLIEDGHAKEDAQAMVDHAFNGNTKLPGTSRVDVVETYLLEQGNFRYNTIKNKIELNGRAIDDRDVNEYTRQLQKLDEKISKTTIETVLGSEFPEKYNPLIEFIKGDESAYPVEKCAGTIRSYVDCFKTGNDELFALLFEKWYVSIIASIYGNHSPLMLVLTGQQGTGKTEVFRRLLPDQLMDYYGESRLDAGKDDNILMCQKLIICNDECGSKNRAESKLFKELASKQTFSLRFPFGRSNVDIRRLAVLCGTTNENELLDDPTGNRRILPVKVLSIDFEKINAIDRTAMLMEAHALFIGGFNYKLTRDEIQILKEASGEFEVHGVEYELVNKHFRVPKDGETPIPMTGTDIKVFLETAHVGQKLNPTRLGGELRRIGFKKVSNRYGNTTKNEWLVVQV